MASSLRVIESSREKMAPPNAKLSGFMLSSFRLIHKVHRIWFWCRRVNIYNNPDNFLKLAAGHAINWLAGDKLVVRIAAQAVLIATRILEAVEEQTALAADIKRFWGAITDRYALPPKMKWSGGNQSRFLSPSTKNGWKIFFKSLVFRIICFAKAFFFVLKRLFALSMRMMDAGAAFSFNASTRKAAVNEIFVNCSEALKKLADDKETLLECLENNKRVIKYLLEGTQSIFTYPQLVNAVKKTIKVSKKIDQGLSKSSKVIGMVGRDMAQRAAFGLFQAAGMTDHLPDKWVPPLKPPWMQKQPLIEDDSRFPPIDWITRKKGKKIIKMKVSETISWIPLPPNAKNSKGNRTECKKVEQEIQNSYRSLINEL